MITWPLAGSLAASAGVFSIAAVAVRRDAAVVSRLGAPRRARSGPGPDGHGRWRDVVRRAGAHRTIVRLAGSSPLAPSAGGWNLSADEIRGLQALAALSAIGVALAGPMPVPLLAPVVGIGAFHAPGFALARAARTRRRQADAELPQLLDLLAAASSAGLGAPAALERAVRAVRGPLAEELEGVLRAVELGARWRDELHRAVDRLPLPDLRRTVSALTRTETLGSSLTEALADLAARVRATHRAAAAERARTAPVKMLFPLVFLILPAFLLLTVVPVLLGTVRSIR